MALVLAKCTQCGGNIEVDNTQDAGICKFCGTPFVTEKVINNYNTYITNNFAGANITMSSGDVENYRTLARRAVASSNIIDALQYYKKIAEINANDWESAYYIEIFSSLTNDMYNVNENAIREYATKWIACASDLDTNEKICKSLSALAKNLYEDGTHNLFKNVRVYYNAILKSTHLYETAYIITKNINTDTAVLYLEKIIDNIIDGKNMLRAYNHPLVGQLIPNIENLEQKYLSMMKPFNPMYLPKSTNNVGVNNSKKKKKELLLVIGIVLSVIMGMILIKLERITLATFICGGLLIVGVILTVVSILWMRK